MPNSRALAAVAATASIVLATLLVASPAQAATLPSGQRITVIDNSNGGVYEANPASAALTFVGPGFALDSDGVTALEVNDDGQGFALLVGPSLGFGIATVAAVDATNGTVGAPVPVVIPSLDDAPAYNCFALDLFTDGKYYTACATDAVGDEMVTIFGELDPVAGELDVIFTFAEYIAFFAFASNPKTGEFTAFEYDQVNEFSGTWVVDPATWTFSTGLELDRPVFAADYDRDGQLFVTSRVEEGQGDFRDQLGTMNAAAGTFSLVGDYSFDGAPVDEFATPPLTIWGKPALANSGATAGDAAPIALAAVLLLLAGAAAVVVRRRSA